MGHDNHAGLSPAHRRNQNPVSPSASLFKRPATFSREDLDQSWMALFRRHQFLLLMVALLAFLCIVYLYFAVKLGAVNCTGLSAQEESLCLLKNSKTKTSHGKGRSRGLLMVQESRLDPWSQSSAQETNAATWMDFLIKAKSIQSVLSLGCPGKDSTDFLLNRLLVSVPAIDCEEGSLLQERASKLPLNVLKMEVSESSSLFDLIICHNCSMIDSINDESKFWKVDRLLRHKGFFLWISEALIKAKSRDASSPFPNIQSHGWACLIRINDFVLWQKP